jgi:hypothetical protein
VVVSGGVGHELTMSFLSVGGLSVNGASLSEPPESALGFRRRGSGFLRGVPAGFVIGFGW